MSSILERITREPREGDELVLAAGLVRYHVAAPASDAPQAVRAYRSETPPSGSPRAPGPPLQEVVMDPEVWRDLARSACSWRESDRA